jgi:hypothetical protein
MTGRNEDVVASSTMVQSLPMSIENKIVVQNNNLGLPFKKKMMILFGNLR